MPSHLHIRKIISFMHTFCCCHNIIRIAGIWIKRDKRTHASNPKIGIDLMSFFYNHSTCHHFMMCRLIHSFLLVFVLWKENPGICPSENIRRRIGLVINLIPIFNFLFVTFHDCNCITHETINHFSIHPASVFFCQVIWHFKVAQCNDRFYAIL